MALGCASGDNRGRRCRGFLGYSCFIRYPEAAPADGLVKTERAIRV